MDRRALQAAHSATCINIVLFVTKAHAAVIKGQLKLYYMYLKLYIWYAVFFLGLFFIFFSLFCSFMVVLGWGFLFGFWIRLLGLGFLVEGVSGLWCEAFWVFFEGWGSLYKHRRINWAKKLLFGTWVDE